MKYNCLYCYARNRSNTNSPLRRCMMIIWLSRVIKPLLEN
jgi:hypothetical protein